MKRLDERGKQCPMPVIETKKALEGAAPGEVIEVIVDNEIAVQNLTKMANHKQLKSQSEKRSNTEFRVQIQAGENAAGTLTEDRDEAAVCLPDGRKGGTVAPPRPLFAGYGGGGAPHGPPRGDIAPQV